MKKLKFGRNYIFVIGLLAISLLIIGFSSFSSSVKGSFQTQSRQMNRENIVQIVPSFTQSIKIQGYLAVWIDDGFKNNRSQPLFTLSTDGGQYFLLNLKNNISDYSDLSGAKVEIMARRTQNKSEENLDVENLIVLNRPDTIKTKGDHSYAGVLVNFSNNPEEVITPEEANRITQEKVRPYYEQVSFGKVTSLTGAFEGWYTFPEISAPIACKFPNNLTLRTIAEIDDHIDFKTIDHLIIVALDLPCDWSGMGSMGTFPFVSNDGLIKNVAISQINYFNSFPYSTIIHELGHNFGLRHSAQYEGDADSCFNRNCSVNEYGNGIDIMGSGKGHFNALQLEKLGWLEQRNIINLVNETNNVMVKELTINNLEDSSNGIILAKLFKGYNNNNIPVWYGVDVRSARVLDDFLGDSFYLENSNYLRGIEINLGIDEPMKKTFWLDLRPAKPANYDDLMGALEPAQSIRTPEGHIIEVLSRDERTARVKFTIVPENYLKADISHPLYSDFNIDSNTVTIQGTATGSNFNSYRLSYAEGLYPLQWQTIHDSTAKINDAVLAELDISNKGTGAYSFKLETFGQSGLSAEQITSIRLQKPSAMSLFEKVPFSSFNEVQDISNGIGVFLSNRNLGNIYFIDLSTQRVQEMRSLLKNIQMVRMDNSIIAVLEKNSDNATFSLWVCDYNKQSNSCKDGLQKVVKSGPTGVFLDVQNNWIIYSTKKINSDLYLLVAYNMISREFIEFSPEVSNFEIYNPYSVGAGNTEQGILVVWRISGNFNGFEAFNLDLRERTFITINGDDLAQHNPRISNGRLAWLKEIPGQNYSTLFVCSINWLTKVCQPTILGADQISRKNELVFSGSLLGWSSENYYTNSDIALFNIEEGKQFFATVSLLADKNPVIDGNFIGWNGSNINDSDIQDVFFTVLPD